VIENLNEVVSRQDKELRSLKLRLDVLAERVKDFGEAESAAGISTETEVPPHY
jgi:uncharacterized coiled-coil protein SlyX